MSVPSNFHSSVIKLYNESHRYYHDTKHINVMLQRLESMGLEQGLKELVRIAVIFHDAIYLPGHLGVNGLNERMSAELFKNCYPEDTKDNTLIYEAILSTHGHKLTTNPVAQALVELDLYDLRHPNRETFSYNTNRLWMESPGVDYETLLCGYTEFIESYREVIGEESTDTILGYLKERPED